MSEISKPKYIETLKRGHALVVSVKPLTGGDIFLAIARKSNKTLCPAHGVDGAIVVWIDSERLFAMWRNDPKPLDRDKACAFGNMKTWKNDRKLKSYPDLINNAKDENNPLFLSNWLVKSLADDEQVSARHEKDTFRMLYATPGDGITRTLGLLVSGVKQFPIVVYGRAAARLMFENAGVAGSKPRSIKALWKMYGPPVDKTEYSLD